ncbi:MAG: hypothetical protein J0L92_26355 [Deltaproteobacteria bacterium]|nr:hypothetical protein [Deltaproteobacteria bacterium]
MSRSRSDLVTWAAIAVSIVALLSGCEPGTCVRESDCPGQTACRAGRCVVVDDAGPVPDGATADVGDVGMPDAWSVDAPTDDAPSADAPGVDAPSADDAPTDDAGAQDASLDASVEDASGGASLDGFSPDANADAWLDDAGVSADTGSTLDAGVVDAGP